MNKIQEARQEFPYLDSGKKYFNHAAISPLPNCVRERIENYLQIRNELDIEPFYKTMPDAVGAKEKLAELLGVKQNQLAWTTNVSEAFSILVNGINWKSGDEIILNDIEFPSNVYPFLNLKSRGVNIKFAKSRDGQVCVNDIEKLVTEKTRLISVSMVQFLTGYRIDLKALGEICGNKEILFCVDGIQGAGAVRVDLNSCGIDFFAGGSHKWLMALQGLGYFYISEKLLERLEQKNVGWTSVKNPWELLDYRLELQEGARKFENGTLSRIAIIALNASLSFFNDIGIEKIENSILNNSLFLRNTLQESGYNIVPKNVEYSNMAGITSFTHNNAANLFKNLEKRNIICSLREGIIRISPHFYNTKDELKFLISELKTIK